MSSNNKLIADAQALEALEGLCAAMQAADLLKTRRYGLKSYKNCAVGGEMVSWLVDQSVCSTREDAVMMGKSLIVNGLLHHVEHHHTFKDANFFYRFGAGTTVMKGNRKMSLADVDSEFDYTGPTSFPESLYLHFPIQPVNHAVQEGEKLGECMLHVSLEDMTITECVRSEVKSSWPFKEVESFGGSEEDPSYFKMEFKTAAKVEFKVLYNNDLLVLRTLFNHILCGEAIDLTSNVKITISSFAAILHGTHGQRFFAVCDNKLYRMSDMTSRHPSAVHPLVGAEAWSDAATSTVYLRISSGYQTGFKVSSEIQMMAWQKALVASIANANSGHSSAASSQMRDTIRRPGVLNTEVFFSYGCQPLSKHQNGGSRSLWVVHVSPARAVLELVKIGEQKQATIPLSNLLTTIVNGDNVGIEHDASGKQQTLWLHMDFIEDVQEFAAIINNLTREWREVPTVNVKYSDEKLQGAQAVFSSSLFTMRLANDSGTLMCDADRVSKISKSRGNACVLTALVLPKSGARHVVHFEAETEAKRDEIYNNAESMASHAASFDLRERYIFHSGFLSVCLAKEKKKTPRYCMLVPGRLYLFKGQTKNWCPVYVISLEKYSFEAKGRQLYLRSSMDANYEVVADTEEAAREWLDQMQSLGSIEKFRSKMLTRRRATLSQSFAETMAEMSPPKIEETQEIKDTLAAANANDSISAFDRPSMSEALEDFIEEEGEEEIDDEDEAETEQPTQSMDEQGNEQGDKQPSTDGLDAGEHSALDDVEEEEGDGEEVQYITDDEGDFVEGEGGEMMAVTDGALPEDSDHTMANSKQAKRKRRVIVRIRRKDTVDLGKSALKAEEKYDFSRVLGWFQKHVEVSNQRSDNAVASQLTTEREELDA